MNYHKMVPPDENQPMDWSMESIIQALESDRLAGRLSSKVSNAAIRYGVDPEDSTRLLAYSNDGTQVISDQ